MPAKKTKLKKVTLEYVDVEDRIRMSAQSEAEGRIVFWLTQRLCGRLVGRLAEYLEKTEPEGGVVERNAMMAFQQQDAGTRHRPAAPVRAQEGDLTVLPAKVDVAWNSKVVALSIPYASEEAAVLQLSRTELRQWMRLLHRQYRKAGWETRSWPAWITAPETGRN